MSPSTPEWRCCRSRSRKTWQSTWLGRDYDAEIMDTQAPQVSSSTCFTKIYGEVVSTTDCPLTSRAFRRASRLFSQPAFGR